MAEQSKIKPLRNSYKWQHVRRKHRKLNPPDKHGNYKCGLCPFPITPDQVVTIDHIIEASEDLTLFFALSNLQDAHEWCNKDKSRPKDNTLSQYLTEAQWRDLKKSAILRGDTTYFKHDGKTLKVNSKGHL